MPDAHSAAGGSVPSAEPDMAAIILACQSLGIDAMKNAGCIRQQIQQCGNDWARWQQRLLSGCFQLPGVGAAALARLQASIQFAELAAWQTLSDQPRLSSPTASGRFLQHHFMGRQRELFCCLFLNSRQQVLAFSDLFEGTLDSAAVYPREVVIAALQMGASGVIAAHNHPSGSVAPSAADIQITHRLRDALIVVDVKLLDHLIIGGGQTYSMASQGDAGFF